jgi:hypothetical protein
VCAMPSMTPPALLGRSVHRLGIPRTPNSRLLLRETKCYHPAVPFQGAARLLRDRRDGRGLGGRPDIQPARTVVAGMI